MHVCVCNAALLLWHFAFRDAVLELVNEAYVMTISTACCTDV